MMGYGAGIGLGMGGWVGMLGFVLLVVGAILLIAWLVGRLAPSTGPAAAPRVPGSDAVEVLRMRFARGEITSEEYLASKETLETDR